VTRLPRLDRILLAATTAMFCVLALQLLAGVGGAWLSNIDDNWTYNLIPIASGATCVAAAWRRPDRAAWICIGLGVAMWGVGDIYYTFALENKATVPYPSLADAGYLAFYPFAYVGVGLLVRNHVVGFVRSLWLDGVIAALTVGALASSIVLRFVLSSLDGASRAAVATNLAYPLADALLLAIVVGLAAVNGWRVTRTWLLVAAGFVLFGLSDSVYLVRVATGVYVYGTVLDLGWLAAMVLLAVAAVAKPRQVRRASLEGRRMLAVPVGFAGVSLALEIVDHWVHLNPVAATLTALSLAAVIGRLGLTFSEYLRVLHRTREEAVTDALTGLGNRRALVADLAGAAESEEPHLLLLFDLNGFKTYNDRYGHPAGDALLARMGLRFREDLAGSGAAYRLGGDEFCAIVRGGADRLDEVRELTVASLSESGEGFHVEPSVGAVVLPDEARDATEALRLVDRRMYQNKQSGRAPGAEGHDVLLGVIEARDPQLATHTGAVTELALAIGRELHDEHVSLPLLRFVAELHDIGKVAVPDAILDKPGPLTEEEWALVRQHSLVGERIIDRAPGLEPVAEAVRATHERWDGAGYPDGLRAAAIPLAARIVAVADAYEAMTSGDRPYRQPKSHEAAVAEILACSGTQFDPGIVRAFVRVLAAQKRPNLAATA
jgi:diguanylate cyclase (GGDEF)-like protein